MTKFNQPPSIDEIIAFIEEQDGKVSRRDLAKAFGLKGPQRIELKKIIRHLVDEGHLHLDRKNITRTPLPKVLIVEVMEIDDRGRALAYPLDQKLAGQIYVEESQETYHRIGDRLKVRIIKKLEDHTYIAKLLEILSDQKTKITGLYVHHKRGAYIEPTERGWPPKIPVIKSYVTPHNGSVVVATITEHKRKLLAAVESILGDSHDPRILSLVTIYNNQLPVEFHLDAINEAEQGKVPPLDKRVDLRHIPLITIDGESARDFDDAVFAQPDPEKPNGWHLMVAIADVSHYVALGSALDREAQNRGNSVYFPDRVIPMLPEKLSNELCSLKPFEDRACLAVHIWINEKGLKVRHQFVRGLMRSHARLTYNQVQKAIDNPEQWDEKTLPFQVIKNLFEAYQTLRNAREYRGTLDIDVDEAEVRVNEYGELVDIALRPRFDSHRIIEEFMILANVAAAETLETFKIPTIYRTHELPDPLKIEELRSILQHLKISFPKGPVQNPKVLAKVLQQVKSSPVHRLINKLVLRTQARAVYSPDNQGHFGLNLQRYAHFTSPIRRYADLMVHHGLLTAIKLAKNSFSRPYVERIARHITLREHQADQAERSLRERYIIHHLKKFVGGKFRGIVDGVAKFGLFVELDEFPVSGFVPRELLRDDFYHFDPKTNQLFGRKHKNSWQMGDIIEVQIIEADALRKRLTLKAIKRL